MKLSDEIVNDLLKDPRRMLKEDAVVSRCYTVSYGYLMYLVKRIIQLEYKVDLLNTINRTDIACLPLVPKPTET